MSVVDERGALDHPISLFAHAARLHRRYPDQPLPRGGRPYPDEPGQDRPPEPRAPAEERQAALTALLNAFLTDQSASRRRLHDELAGLDLPGWIIEPAVEGLRPPDPARARRTGAWLVRHGRDRRPVAVGLALLATTSQPADARLVRTVGLLDLFAPAAVRALANLSDATPHLIWLAARSARYARVTAVRALCRPDDPRAVAWLRRHAVADGERVTSSDARAIAEAVALPEAVEEGFVDQPGRLLLAMATVSDYRVELAGYGGARRAYAALARRLPRAEPSLARYAMVAGLAQQLRTGHAACLAWEPGEREDVAARLRAVLRRDGWRDRVEEALRSPDPLVRRRAAWARASDVDVPGGFRIVVVPADPARDGDVETRMLVDGWPVVAAAFDKGAPYPPESLLAAGSLRAAAEPREVRLAEAYCTEGCCGALYVTVVRAGDTVVWRDWRGYTGDAPPPPLRFAAAGYDAEVARAEADHAWEWPARTVARLLRARLAAEPILARWGCELDWVWARAGEPDRLRLSLHEPATSRYHHQAVPVDDTAPADQVDRIVDRLARADPRAPA